MQWLSDVFQKGPAVDARAFDSLARLLAGATSRREAFLGALASLLPLAGDAKRKRVERHRNKERADTKEHRQHDGREERTRRPERRAPAGSACQSVGQRCRKHRKTGKRGRKAKGAPCAKCCTRHSVAQPNGARRCACKPGGAKAGNPSQCCSGRLSPGGFCGACDPDRIECGGSCVDPQTDNANCGRCGVTCAASQRCEGGTCAGDPHQCDGTTCPTGCCDADGACRDGTANDFCGTTGAPCERCPTGGACVAGACVSVPPPCGGTGQPCCVLGPACTAGGCCDRETCVAAGDPCGPAAACSDGTLTPRGTCEASTCEPAEPVRCAPYGCDGERCADHRQVDGDCAGDHFCNAMGRCAGDKALGESCGRDAACASGFCVEGICCDSACDAHPNSACAAGGICGCTPETCGDRDCGPIANGCGATIDCPADTCAGTTPVCAGSACVACSEQNRCPLSQCCAPDGSCVGVCGTGTTCWAIDGFFACLPCGTSDDRCCFGPGVSYGCNEGLGCTPIDGVPRCVPCGGGEQACCMNAATGDRACDTGLTCRPVTGGLACVPCGGNAEACCTDGGAACGQGLTCIAGDEGPLVCAPCGDQNQPCCINLMTITCNPGMTCGVVEEIPQCVPCGAPDKHCCYDFAADLLSCDADLICTCGGGQVCDEFDGILDGRCKP